MGLHQIREKKILSTKHTKLMHI